MSGRTILKKHQIVSVLAPFAKAVPLGGGMSAVVDVNCPYCKGSKSHSVTGRKHCRKVKKA